MMPPRRHLKRSICRCALSAKDKSIIIGELSFDLGKLLPARGTTTIMVESHQMVLLLWSKIPFLFDHFALPFISYHLTLCDIPNFDIKFLSPLMNVIWVRVIILLANLYILVSSSKIAQPEQSKINLQY